MLHLLLDTLYFSFWREFPCRANMASSHDLFQQFTQIPLLTPYPIFQLVHQLAHILVIESLFYSFLGCSRFFFFFFFLVVFFSCIFNFLYKSVILMSLWSYFLFFVFSIIYLIARDKPKSKNQIEYSSDE